MTDDNIELLKKIEEHLNIIHKEGLRTKNPYTSKSAQTKNLSINTKEHDIIKLNGVYGHIKQLLIKANSLNFSLSISTDKRKYLNENYTWLNANQDYIVDMSAFLVGGVYIVSVQDIYFQNDCNIAIKTTSDVQFSDILVLFNVRGEEVVVY